MLCDEEFRFPTQIRHSKAIVHRGVSTTLNSAEPKLRELLKPGDYEVLTSSGGCFQKAVDLTKPSVPKGSETYAFIEQTLRDALNAMGGDNPPPGGGPAEHANTFSYLKPHIAGASELTDLQFRQLLTFYLGLAPDRRLNIERIQLTPVLVEDD